MKKMLFAFVLCATASSCRTAHYIESHPYLGKCFANRYDIDYQQGDGLEEGGRGLAKLKGYDYFENSDGNPKGKIVVNKKGCVFQITRIIYSVSPGGDMALIELSSKNELCGADHVYHRDDPWCLKKEADFSREEIVPRKKNPLDECLVNFEARLVDCPK